MIVAKLNRGRGSPGKGVVWPHNGLSTPGAIDAPYGPRYFSAHSTTKGHTNDFHRGCDIAASVGDAVYSPISGHVSRVQYEHANWYGEYADQFTKEDSDGLFNVDPVEAGNGVLQLTYNLQGTISSTAFLDSAKLIHAAAIEVSDDVEIRLDTNSARFDGDGGLGIALYNPNTGEYAALEADNTNGLGTTLTCHSVDSAGADATDGTSTYYSGFPFKGIIRIVYDASAATVTYQGSNTGQAGSWTTLATWSSVAWTDDDAGLAPFRVCIYLRKTSTSAGSANGSVGIRNFGVSHPNTIGRFGNFVQIQNELLGASGERWLLMHLSRVDVAEGDFVEAGAQIGRVGSTGFDEDSGPINTAHIHFERIPNVDYFYSNDEPINPLGAGGLPHTTGASNVSVSYTEENDPNADASHRLAITVSRADQDFDLDEISLTGNLATRTLNFNSRAGLNPADSDDPDYDGVYVVAQSGFDDEATEYVIDVYFDKAVVGTTLTSWTVKDTEGTTLDAG